MRATENHFTPFYIIQINFFPAHRKSFGEEKKSLHSVIIESDSERFGICRRLVILLGKKYNFQLH